MKILIFVFSMLTSFVYANVNNIGLVDVADEKVIFKKDNNILEVDIYSAPNESNKVGKLSLPQTLKLVETLLKKKDSEGRESVIRADPHFDGFCGGQLFTLFQSTEEKDGFHKIQIFWETYWVKGKKYPLSVLNKNFPLSIYTHEGHQLEILKIENELVQIKEINTYDNPPVQKLKKLSEKDLFDEEGELLIRIRCDGKNELSLAKKHFHQKTANNIVEPVLVDFLADQSLKNMSNERTLLKVIPLYESSSSESKKVGQLKVIGQKNTYSLEFSNNDLLNVTFKNNMHSGPCNQSRPYLLHHSKEKRGKFVNLGSGPWGENAWAVVKNYGLFTDSPLNFIWLSHKNAVKFKLRNNQIFAEGYSLFGGFYGDLEQENVILPVDFADLFNKEGTLDLELNCYSC